jgi:glyoxylase-like metal-dependent hydrolase (beta-lactamase superfamily II)
LPGAAKVVYISPEGEVSDYATGLSMITDLRLGTDGELYAVQIGEFTEQGPVPNSGAIWRIAEGDGSEIVYTGLSFPTSVDFNEAGDGFITINGVGAPGSGAVVMVPGLTAMSAVMEEGTEEGAAGGEMMALPVPEAAMGPEIPQDTGYLVEEIGRGLYWVTDGSYQIIFLTTGEGVIVVDAPPSMGEKILSAIADVTDEPVTHVIYSHAHADHIGGAGLFPPDATYIAHAETAAILEARAADDPEQELPFAVLSGGGPVPLPTETFEDSYILEVGDQVLELAYYGANHSHGNTFVYAPEQGVLMVVDVVYPGWSPFRSLAEDMAGYLAAHDQILAYDFDIYIGGHLGRYGTREDVETQKAYIEDIIANALTALQTTDFMAIAGQTGFANPWLLFNTYLGAVAQNCADLTIANWGEVLGGVDINASSHCDRIISYLRVN